MAGAARTLRRRLAQDGQLRRTSLKDVASFTGLAATALRPVLARLALERFRGEDGEELLDVPGAPLPHPETPAPPRFLPEEHRPKLFSTKTPHSFPTFLVDGAVAGKWRHERGGIALEPFGRLDAATRRALRGEAERLAALHA